MKQEELREILQNFLVGNIRTVEDAVLAIKQAGWIDSATIPTAEPFDLGEWAKANGYVKKDRIEEAKKQERERIWSQLELIDNVSLDDRDFVRRVCNLIVELKPKALKSPDKGE